MDYVKEAENYLRHYASLKKSVSHAKFMIDQLAFRACPGEVSAITNDITGVSAQHPVNTLQEMYELQKWKAVCEDSAGEIAHIEELLNGMDEKEHQLLDLWYIQRAPVIDIMTEMDYETRQAVYNLKSRAVKNFSVILFGIHALKAI